MRRLLLTNSGTSQWLSSNLGSRCPKCTAEYRVHSVANGFSVLHHRYEYSPTSRLSTAVVFNHTHPVIASKLSIANLKHERKKADPRMHNKSFPMMVLPLLHTLLLVFVLIHTFRHIHFKLLFLIHADIAVAH